MSIICVSFAYDVSVMTRMMHAQDGNTCTHTNRQKKKKEKLQRVHNDFFFFFLSQNFRRVSTDGPTGQHCAFCVCACFIVFGLLFWSKHVMFEVNVRMVHMDGFIYSFKICAFHKQAREPDAGYGYALWTAMKSDHCRTTPTIWTWRGIPVSVYQTLSLPRRSRVELVALTTSTAFSARAGQPPSLQTREILFAFMLCFCSYAVGGCCWSLFVLFCFWGYFWSAFLDILYRKQYKFDKGNITHC